MKLIRYLIAIAGTLTLIYFVIHIGIGIYMLFLVPFALATITGIGYETAVEANHKLREAWRWVWQQPANMWTWAGNTKRGNLNDLKNQ